MPWSPFSRPLSELAETDLGELRGRSEGSRLEYKREIHGGSLAKGVAAFANTHGGCLFIGIEAEKGSNNPVFPLHGVDPAEYQLEQLRQTITSSIDPVPDVQIARVGLDAPPRVVFVIAVDEGAEPPYIRTQDGRVYVRRGQVSEPLDFVRHRHELDELYARGEKYRQRVDEVLKAEGHGKTLPALHHSDLRNYGVDVPLAVSVVLVPTGAALDRFGAPWADDDEALSSLWRAVLDGLPRPVPVERWQHGRWVPPGTVDGGNGETAAVAMSRHGILELSVALPDGRSPRNQLLHPVTTFFRMAVAIYWKHQYDAGLRVEATLREGDSGVRASRTERLPFAAWSGAPWHLACRDQSASTWGDACADSILSELLVGLATNRRMQVV